MKGEALQGEGIQGEGISLWWVPAEPVLDQLRAVIHDLARRHGGPPFEPHATLLGGIQGEQDAILEKATALARSLSPLELRFGAYGHEPIWSRWLYRKIEPDPPVMEAGRLARAHFGSTDDRPYTPHLSLLYGVYDEHLVYRIIGSDPAPPLSFRVERLHIVSTAGPVADWQVLAVVPLKGA